MANNRFQARRTSTAGLVPNTTNSGNSQYVYAGEFGLNTTDKILYTSDGSVLIEVGANNSNKNISNNLTVSNNLIVTNNIASNNSSLTTQVWVGNTTVNAIVNSTALYLANSTSNVTLAIPTAADWALGTKFLNANGSWTVQSGTATPGGSNTQIQYNNSGTMDGSANLVWYKTNNTIVISNTMIVTGGGNVGISMSYGVLNSTSKAFWIQSAETNNNTDITMLTNGTGAASRLILFSNGVTTSAGYAYNFDAGAASISFGTATGGTSRADWYYYSNSTYAGMTFSNTGNVAIGNVAGYVAAKQFEIKDGNFYISNSTSNTGVPIPTSAQYTAGKYYLNANGSWVYTVPLNIGSSTNTQTIFNDSGDPNGTAGFTFDKTTNTVTVSNQISVTSTLFVGNSTVNSVVNTAIKLSNSTSNVTVSVPTSGQYTGGVTYLNANGTWKNVAGGSNTTVLINDSTAANGTAGFTFDKSTNSVFGSNNFLVTRTSNSAATNTTTTALLAETIGPTVVVPGYRTNANLSLHICTSLQAHMGRSVFAFSNARTNGAGLSSFGHAVLQTGTQTSNNQTTGSVIGQMRRNHWANTTASNVNAFRSGYGTYTACYMGNAAGYGGFLFNVKFQVVSFALNGTPTGQFYIGFRNSNTSWTTGQTPATQTNHFGIGCSSASDTVFKLYSANASTINAVALPSYWSVANCANIMYDFWMYCPPNSQTVTYKIVDLANTAANTSGTMPAVTSLLVNTKLNWHIWQDTSGLTSGTQNLGVTQIYLETEF